MAKSLLNPDSIDPGSLLELIDWSETEKQFGYNASGTGLSTKSVVCNCPGCSARFITRYCKLKRRSRPLCNKCIREESKSKISLSLQKRYSDTNLRETVSAGVRKKWRDDLDFRQRATSANKRNGAKKSSAKSHPEAIKELWCTKRYRLLQELAKSNPLYKSKLSKALKIKWLDDDYRSKISLSSRRLWTNNEYRHKLASALARQPRISSIQRTLYEILDDLSLTYEPEFVLGPWTFDCCVRLPESKDILIECQGDY